MSGPAWTHRICDRTVIGRSCPARKDSTSGGTVPGPLARVLSARERSSRDGERAKDVDGSLGRVQLTFDRVPIIPDVLAQLRPGGDEERAGLVDRLPISGTFPEVFPPRARGTAPWPKSSPSPSGDGAQTRGHRSRGRDSCGWTDQTAHHRQRGAASSPPCRRTSQSHRPPR